MSDKISAYIINESKGVESEPSILNASKEICRFKVDYMQEADSFNRNRRNYPWDLLYKACTEDPTLQERLSTGTLYCEIGHPEEKSIARQLQIKRENSACIIKSLSYKKPYIGAILETCATVKGRDLMGLITVNKCKVAFSMRGVGRAIEKNGYFQVVAPLRIVTWDDVVQPSVSKAYLSEIITESVNTHNKAPRISSMNEALIALSDADLKKYLFSTDKQLKSFCEQMEIEATPDKIVLNEDGTLSIFDKDSGRTFHVNTNKFIKNEIHSFLKGL